MIQILLLSRRNPNGPWHIRNRHGIYRATDARSIRAAREAAAMRIPGWQRAEPFTEFQVAEEPYKPL
jgi:hypothetical protein